MATQKDRNWLKLVPYATWTMNNQLHKSTGFAPADLFFGRPSWIPDMIPDPDQSPVTENWIVHQIELQDKATKILQELREKQLKRANRRRTEAHYREGEFVLIHKRRFPQWPTTVLGSQWFGPYRVTRVKPNSVMVHASPKLGGDVEVAYTYLKKFPQGIETNEDDDPEDEEKIAEQDEALAPEVDVASPEEPDAPGFYPVESILKHKYKQGWRFLTKWENWPLSDATWEPVRAFIQPNGQLNTIFSEYCQRNGLEKPLRQAIQRATRESV